MTTKISYIYIQIKIRSFEGNFFIWQKIEELKMKSLKERIKHEHDNIIKEENNYSASQVKREEYHGVNEDSSYKEIKCWLSEVEPIKLIKLSEDMMTRVLENWSKFRLNVLKHLNEEQTKVIDSMAKLRKEVQWLNQLRSGQVPQLNKISIKLFKDCEQLIQNQTKFDIRSMIKQSKLVTDKILDTTRLIYDELKYKISDFHSEIKKLCCIKQILTEKTYFRFLKDQRHSQIIVMDNERISTRNQSYDMDFGAVIGPMLTKSNNKIGLRIETNDKYQCFIGLGVCHIDIVRDQIYKGTGPGSGSYVIRQQNDSSQAVSLNHAYQKYGSHLKQNFVGWGFGQGDTILIQVDFDRNYVCFSKDDKFFEMPIQKNESSIAAYVVVHSRWDCVAIMNS